MLELLASQIPLKSYRAQIRLLLLLPGKGGVRESYKETLTNAELEGQSGLPQMDL